MPGVTSRTKLPKKKACAFTPKRNGDDEIIVDKGFVSYVLKVVDKGLSHGLGRRIPGKMCVEAAVAFASGEDHHDNPTCVDEDLAGHKIGLNDTHGWPDAKARAAGLRRVAIAQLGSAGRYDDSDMWDFCENYFQDKAMAYFKTANLTLDDLIASAVSVRDDGPPNNFDGYSGRFEDLGMKRHEALCATAEMMVQALIDQKIPGTKYLHLTEGKKRIVKKAWLGATRAPMKSGKGVGPRSRRSR